MIKHPGEQFDLFSSRPFDGGVIEDKHGLAVLMPPIVSGPSFTIRKRASRVFTLDDYVEAGILLPAAFNLLSQAIETRRNILVVGGTGSGKTTFVNAIIDGISRYCPTDRLIIIEDTAELQSASENTVFMNNADEFDSHIGDLLSTPDGQMQALESANELAALQLKEARELRTLLVTSTQADIQDRMKAEKQDELRSTWWQEMTKTDKLQGISGKSPKADPF